MYLNCLWPRLLSDVRLLGVPKQAPSQGLRERVFVFWTIFPFPWGTRVRLWNLVSFPQAPPMLFSVNGSNDLRACIFTGPLWRRENFKGNLLLARLSNLGECLSSIYGFRRMLLIRTRRVWNLLMLILLNWLSLILLLRSWLMLRPLNNLSLHLVVLPPPWSFSQLHGNHNVLSVS